VRASGANGCRGWLEDVKIMLLSIGKLKTEWKPKHKNEQAVRLPSKTILMRARKQ